MSLSHDLLALASRIETRLPFPAVTGLYFPPLHQDGVFRDEFGFVFLEGGAIGPFYVSLGDTLPRLWQQYPQPAQAQPSLWQLLDGLNGRDPCARALAIGAYNALSQQVLQRAGYPLQTRKSRTDTDQATGGPVGMVGYFCPLVERLVAQGTAVVVLEYLPERINPHPLVRYTPTPAGLRACTQIICSASTLINDTLESIVSACPQAQSFRLIGPSAGGLPDGVFAHGVDQVGASTFRDAAALSARLDRGEPWGNSSEKYEISRPDYPGLEALLQALPQPDRS
ncbi:MAG: hypothetical protein KDI44_18905 [Thiothrix sp.]|nr:hypothetical protein [Thiothrix sp.]HPQ95019.1 DUF364 domain-containing protein [Thiolinea sp.]